jgi:RimJ/RimL family protein N-acetyltransferase
MSGEAIYEILRYAFNVMDLQTIEAKVTPGNKGAIFVLKQMGFKETAVLKDHICINGKYSDVAVYSLFKSELNF